MNKEICQECGETYTRKMGQHYCEKCMPKLIDTTSRGTGFFRTSLTEYSKVIHQLNLKWWNHPNGEVINRNFGELIALCHSELSEALEGKRKDLMDDKLPHRKMFEVELADTLIRIFDMCGAYGIDIGSILHEKCEYNRNRADHSYEERAKEGGKKF